MYAMYDAMYAMYATFGTILLPTTLRTLRTLRTGVHIYFVLEAPIKCLKHDFDLQTVCKLPVCWLKYTTELCLLMNDPFVKSKIETDLFVHIVM